MAKPIFIARLPLKSFLNKEEAMESIRNSLNSLTKTLGSDYYILVILDELVEATVFECYNAEKCDEVKIEDLKERLTILMESAIDLIKISNNQQKKAPVSNHINISKDKIDSFSRMFAEARIKEDDAKKYSTWFKNF